MEADLQMPKTSKMAGWRCFHFCNSACDPREKLPVSKSTPHLHPEIILFTGKSFLHQKLVIQYTKVLPIFSIHHLLFPSDCTTLIKWCSAFVNKCYNLRFLLFLLHETGTKARCFSTSWGYCHFQDCCQGDALFPPYKLPPKTIGCSPGLAGGEGARQEQLSWECLGWVWKIPAPGFAPSF